MMSLVADYSSDSHGEEELASGGGTTQQGVVRLHEASEKFEASLPKNPAPESPSEVPEVSSSPVKVTSLSALPPPKSKGLDGTRKKRKKTKIKFLPDEVRELLQKRNLDSEDEDDLPAGKRGPEVNVIAPHKHDDDASAGLLGALPAPKREPKSSGRINLGTEALSSIHNQPASSSEALVESSAYTETTRASASMPANEAVESEYGSNIAYYGDQQYLYEATESASFDAYEDHHTNKTTRKRQRDLEMLLQQGNVEGLQVHEVQGFAGATDWKPTDAGSTVNTGQLKVAAKVWNPRAGTETVTLKPTRVQRRKHQINQLAYDAKARELELLERSASGMRTKAQTRAKYGW